MYRKRNGSMGFSFTKFANAAVPNLFADNTLSTQPPFDAFRKDMLYNHQLASTNFTTLDEHSFFVAGVVDHERVSKNVHKALTKHEILDTEGKVNTYKIGPGFINQLAIIDTRRQKELVNMLFWWEEECYRFNKLKEEDEELSSMIQEAEKNGSDGESGREMVDRLKFARERVRMKIRQSPSQRRDDTEANTDNIMDAFRGRASSAPTIVGAAAEGSTVRSQEDEALPDYHLVASKY